MQALVEFLPLLIFFAVYKLQDIFWATGALMIAFSIQLLVTFLMKKPITKQQWILFTIAMVFGGFTLLLRDETFIMWKPTVIYVIFAIVLFTSQIMKKPALKQMMNEVVDMPDKNWNRVNAAWGIFFLIAAVVNLVVAYRFTEEQWVDFKVFWMSGASLLFTFVTIAYMYKFMPTDADDKQQDKS